MKRERRQRAGSGDDSTHARCWRVLSRGVRRRGGRRVMKTKKIKGLLHGVSRRARHRRVGVGESAGNVAVYKPQFDQVYLIVFECYL